MSNRISVFLPFLIFLALIFLELGCKHPTDPSSPNAPDTNWVTQPQVDISWPGLASSPWPMFLHDPQHTARSPYRGPQLGQVEWMFTTTGLVYPSPIIDVDGTVYVGCLRGDLFAVLPNGVQEWSVYGGGVSSAMVASDRTIYFDGNDSTGGAWLFSYDGTGHLNWKYPIDVAEGYSSVLISKDGQTIYLASGYLYAIRKNGTLGWKMKPDSTSTLHYSPAMSPDGTTLYVTSFTALNAIDTSGVLKWAYRGETSDPAVDNDGNVYFGINTTTGGLCSVSKDGTVRWVANDIYWSNNYPGPVIGRDGTIYITGHALYAVDYAGKLKWKYPLPGLAWSQCVPATDLDGTIYFGKGTSRTPDDSLNFFALNPNGTLKFAMCLKSPDGSIPDIDSPPSIGADGSVYVGSDYPHGTQLYKIK
ncbi:MAG TPA: PQQ-binding-like beta-propeller repeat protein [Bacteroidota bacterium]|nr:PQQ-binding-like beta-propeller repeat protein [Bacteroidota bacterium]